MHWKAKSTIQMQRIIPYYLKLVQKFLHSLPSMNMWKKGHFLWAWFNLSLGEEAKLGRKGGAVPDISCSFCPCFFLPQQRRAMCSGGCPGPGSRTPCLASTALSHLLPSPKSSLTEFLLPAFRQRCAELYKERKGCQKKMRWAAWPRGKHDQGGEEERDMKREKSPSHMLFPWPLPVPSHFAHPSQLSSYSVFTTERNFTTSPKLSACWKIKCCP